MARAVETAKRMVAEGLAAAAMIVLIDEGGWFIHRQKQHEGLTWEKWNCGGANPRIVHVMRGVFSPC